MKFTKLILLAVAILVAASWTSAQITQTGTINGTVKDDQGQPLPGVAVTIKSPALILPEMNMATTDSGGFRFPALPPGTYTVRFELAGFKSLVREGIRVNVGVTTTLDIALEMSAISESITVIGESPTVDVQKTTIVASLTSEFLQNIPAPRDLSSFFNMAPGVTGDTTHGSSERDNTYNIDGVNITDPVTGTQAGNFGIDIMEELSIQTGGLPAEYGSVRGGVINVVTKSGGNSFSGMASFYFQKDSFQADNTKGTIFAGQKSGFDYEIEPAFVLGGPVLKDKIWFFGNFSLRKSQEFLPGYPYDEEENQALDYYRIFPYLKATLQLSKKDRLVLSFNFSDYKRHHRGAAVTRTVDSTWNQTTPITTYNVQYTRVFNSDFFMNVKGAFMNYALNLTAKNDLPQIYDSGTRQYSQSYGYDDIYSRDRYQALADGTYFAEGLAGRHEFKLGAEFEFSKDSRYRRHNRGVNDLGPFFTYVNGVPSYVTNYQDFTRLDNKLVLGGFFQDSWTPIDRLTLNLGLRFDHQEGIIPVQGTEREAIEYGGTLYDPRVLESFKPIIWNTLAPRLGATLDLTGDGKTAIKASFSRYYVANIMQWFVTVNPNSFISYRYRLDADGNPYGSMYYFSATAEAQMDPNLKAPYIDEFTFGIERELVRDLRVGARYIRKWDRNLIESVDLNALDYDALMAGADIFDPALWTNFEPIEVVDLYDGQTQTFWNMIDDTLPYVPLYTNPPGAERNYDGVEITINKRFARGWSLIASYVYQKSRGLIGTDFDDSWSGQGYYDEPNYHINAYGNFPFERRHQVKIQFMWRGPWGVDLSGYFRFLDGNRYARQIRSQDFGLDLNQGSRTIYAETRGIQKEPGLYLLDLRAEKVFKIPGKIGNLALFVDMFNAFNVNTATTIQSISGYTQTVNGYPVPYGQLTAITDPMNLRLGVKFEF